MSIPLRFSPLQSKAAGFLYVTAIGHRASAIGHRVSVFGRLPPAASWGTHPARGPVGGSAKRLRAHRPSLRCLFPPSERGLGHSPFAFYLPSRGFLKTRPPEGWRNKRAVNCSVTAACQL